MTVMTGAQALVRALEELGVTDVFGDAWRCHPTLL